MTDTPDQLDLLLARAGRAGADGDARRDETPPQLDELALERLRRGKLGDDERSRLIESLAADRTLREAWIESMEERIPLDETLEGRIADAVFDQRRGEGLPVGSATVSSSGLSTRWLAMAAGLAVLIGVGAVIYGTVRPGAPLPDYQVTVAGQLADVRGDDPAATAAIPSFGEGGTLTLTLHPDQVPDGGAAPRLAVVAPDGQVRTIDDPAILQVEERDGVFVLRGKADALFGEQAGRWLVVVILEPDQRHWSDARIAAEAGSVADDPTAPTSAALGGGRRLLTIPLDYTP